MNESSLPHQHSQHLPPPSSASSFLSLLEAQPTRGRRWDGVVQPWLQDSQSQQCGEKWVWETIFCLFLIQVLSGFPLIAVGGDSLLTESLHTSAWTGELCAHILWPQRSKKTWPRAAMGTTEASLLTPRSGIPQYSAGSRPQHKVGAGSSPNSPILPIHSSADISQRRGWCHAEHT